MFYSCILWLSYQLIILLKNNNKIVRCNITNQIMTFSNMFRISIMVVCKSVQAFALSAVAAQTTEATRTL